MWQSFWFWQLIRCIDFVDEEVRLKAWSISVFAADAFKGFAGAQ